MKLTDNQKRDIVRHIEEDKPLPDKYRFLLFKDSRKVEINWESKSDQVLNDVIPFQTIENIDEPRAETELQGSFFDPETGRQLQGWTNKLIWGDNKYILSSLINGPMRKEIEKEGGVKLIYIDPPFSVGQDYTIPVEIPDEEWGGVERK